MVWRFWHLPSVMNLIGCGTDQEPAKVCRRGLEREENQQKWKSIEINWNYDCGFLISSHDISWISNLWWFVSRSLDLWCLCTEKQPYDPFPGGFEEIPWSDVSLRISTPQLLHSTCQLRVGHEGLSISAKVIRKKNRQEVMSNPIGKKNAVPSVLIGSYKLKWLWFMIIMYYFCISGGIICILPIIPCTNQPTLWAFGSFLGLGLVLIHTVILEDLQIRSDRCFSDLKCFAGCMFDIQHHQYSIDLDTSIGSLWYVWLGDCVFNFPNIFGGIAG